MSEFGILTFQSTHHAMRAEKVLTKEGIKIKTIPTPRDITLSCGLAIRFEVEEIEKIKELKNEGKLDYKELHHLQTIDGERRLKKLD
ncbi:DUF3343 domain-containing protein [Gudongella sp. DL1XJH-153]|uniref:DUF3343 domain-containing protein n=1 Tax=Gudongella sp. DL1XJH-153 TaxID=3409804 RepID=UPI003BB4C0B5